MSKKLRNLLIFSFPIVFGVLMFGLRTLRYDIYEIIGWEDNVIEYMQFVFFLLSSIVSILIALRFFKTSKPLTIIFAFISLSLLVISFEEVSWGERMLDIAAPAIFDGESEIPVLKNNVQGEMNLHNFEPIHNLVMYGYLAICIYACTSWIFGKIKFKEDIEHFIAHFVVSPYLIPYFFPLIINIFNPTYFAPQDYEMTEFLLSLGTLIFLLLLYFDIRNKELKS